MKLQLENLDNRWLALQVRSKWETRAAFGLQSRGYEYFVPLYQQKRLWSDRSKIVEVPLFPGYVFFRFNAQNEQPVISIPGVLRFVGTGNSPVPIADHEIEALQITTKSAVTYGPCKYLEQGQQVQIRNGSLAGMRGSIERIKNKQRLILNVSLLRKSMFVEVDGYDVVIVDSHLSPAEHQFANAVELQLAS